LKTVAHRGGTVNPVGGEGFVTCASRAANQNENGALGPGSYSRIGERVTKLGEDRKNLPRKCGDNLKLGRNTKLTRPSMGWGETTSNNRRREAEKRVNVTRYGRAQNMGWGCWVPAEKNKRGKEGLSK